MAARGKEWCVGQRLWGRSMQGNAGFKLRNSRGVFRRDWWGEHHRGRALPPTRNHASRRAMCCNTDPLTPLMLLLLL